MKEQEATRKLYFRFHMKKVSQETGIKMSLIALGLLPLQAHM